MIVNKKLLALSRGMIFLAIDVLSELSFFGRLSSIVRMPYRVLKSTSSGSSPGSSRGMIGVCICIVRQWKKLHSWQDCETDL
jgi:hypothetical protein